MQGINSKRLQTELLGLQETDDGDQSLEVTAKLIDNCWDHWIGRIKGPVDTPFEGGYFFILINIPKDYPYVPPKMKFHTKVWHPNVSSKTGAICLDILKDAWSPALSIRTALLSIAALLGDPMADDPQDAEVAKMFIQNYDLYCKTVKIWIKKYALEKEWPYEHKIETLVNLGISRSLALNTLINNDWNIDAAASSCLSLK